MGYWKKKMTSLHRIILGLMLGRELTRNDICDHINGNPLDNRRDNLRLATRSQNGANASIYVNNKTGYKGVSIHKKGKYRAEMSVQGKTKHLGLFDTPQEAHKA